ncbi:MAG: glycosyltransferase family 2 protein [Acidobacteriota bacterium]
MLQQHSPQALTGSLAALVEGVSPQALELAIVIPTYNERANVAEIVSRLERALAGIRFEVLFVDDDSPDGTSEVVRELAMSRPWVRSIRRIGRRGLASACIEGMLATVAPAIAVMDADLQHDESVLRRMFDTLREDSLDVVIGTRNTDGGSMGKFAPWRVKLSNLGLRTSRVVTRIEITDPMSGFFLVTRGFVNEVVHHTSGIGFKILVDMLASAKRPLRVAEVPYIFRDREHGESKLDLNVGLEYLYLVLDKLLGDRIPVRFALYVLVGAAGLLLHLGTLGALLHQNVSFAQAQMAATGVAMTANFLLNNMVTHREARLSGWRLLPGLATFYLACSVGFATNLSISEQLLSRGLPWLWAGLAGLAISSVWNYGVTSVFTWRRLKHKALRA